MGDLGIPASSAASGRRQLPDVLAKEELRGGFVTEIPMPQIHLVCVHGEDLGLGEVSLDLDGHQGFLDFAPEALLGRQEELSAELLGEGAGPLSSTPLGEVRDRGPHDAQDIDAPVALEMAVLDGDDRVPEHRRDLVVGHNDAPLQGEAADDRAVVRVKVRHHVRPVIFQLANLRQVGRVDKDQSGQRPHPGREQEQNQKHKLPENLAAAHLGRCWPGRRRRLGDGKKRIRHDNSPRLL